MLEREEHMDKKHYSFYDMVKNWTVSDFRTPGIKAEVIVDMLISDFIVDLIQYHYWDREQYTVRLLTKELPVKLFPKEGEEEISEENNRNAKVDYLVSVGNEKLVLVELKTTNDSYVNKQEERMKEAVKRGPDELLKFYEKIAGRKKGNSSDRMKYKISLGQYQETLSAASLSREGFKEVDYLYISLTDYSRLPEGKKLILEDYCRNGVKYKGFSSWLMNDEKGEKRNQLWEKVSDILLECAGKPVK